MIAIAQLADELRWPWHHVAVSVSSWASVGRTTVSGCDATLPRSGFCPEHPKSLPLAIAFNHRFVSSVRGSRRFAPTMLGHGRQVGDRTLPKKQRSGRRETTHWQCPTPIRSPRDTTSANPPCPSTSCHRLDAQNARKRILALPPDRWLKTGQSTSTRAFASDHQFVLPPGAFP